MLTGYILTNDKKLPEYQEKIRILNKIMPMPDTFNDTNEYEQCFLVYFIFYYRYTLFQNIYEGYEFHLIICTLISCCTAFYCRIFLR
jgi:hypothetical protein